MQNHAIPCNTMQYHAIPWNTMQYNAIPCNTMQYHGTLITADGAYHCPVGSIMAIFSSVRSSNSLSDLPVTQQQHPFFQITPVLVNNLGMTWALLWKNLARLANTFGQFWHCVVIASWRHVMIRPDQNMQNMQNMHNQCIIYNCWRSVPLLCGQYMAIFVHNN